MSGPADPLWLDHLTLAVPDFAQAVAILREQFGLRTTITPQAPERHGRILLDRCYIEVVRNAVESDELAVPWFFLGHPDVPAAVARLRAAGLARDAATPYHGADGTWWNAMLRAPAGVPAPLLVQRIEPAEVAAKWPPPLAQPHPSGVVRLGGVLVVTSAVGAAVDFYRLLVTALTGTPATATSERVRHPLADQEWRVPLPDGARIVVCDPVRAGPAREHLLRRGAGLAGFELLSADLDATAAYLSRQDIDVQATGEGAARCLWLHPDATPGIRVAVRPAC